MSNLIPILIRDKSHCIEAEEHLSLLFNEIDINKDGELTKDEFINRLKDISFVDISEIEAIRLFESIDIDDSNTITLQEFVQAAKHIRWIRTLGKVFAASKVYTFNVPDNYDYSKSTKENYNRNDHVFFGNYADIREKRCYEYHGNYTKERQEWQDMAVKSCLGRTESQPRPWVVFTCGPMGVGKGHVFSWLSSQGLFPLEYIAHIDPDFFKRIMPEWNSYVKIDREVAGTLCHLESGYLQEIAQEVAMRQRQHVWIDGSLSDGEWFSQYFDEIRENYPHYRIAIFYINAPESTIRQRIAQRSSETGRSIPESAILRSLKSPENSLKLLAPKTDLVVRIWNDTSIELKSVEDYSRNWHGALGKHFGTISMQPSIFPNSLGPFYLETTSFHGNVLVPIENSSMESILNLQIDSGDWVPFWFELNSEGILTAYELTQLGRFESIHTWNIDENTIIQEINSPSLKLSSQNLITPLSKKRNYDMSFQTIPEIEKGVTFQIEFSIPTSIEIVDTYGHNTTSPLLYNKKKIILAAKDHDCKLLWIKKIQSYCEKLSDTDHDSDINSQNDSIIVLKKSTSNIFYRSDTGTTINRRMMPIPSQQYEKLKLSPLHCQTSPSLLKLLWKLGKPIILTSSPKYRLDGKLEELELSGTPHGTTHSRYVFPNEVSDFTLDYPYVIPKDPDILFLCWGGFVHYNKFGVVLNTMTMSRDDKEYFIQYSDPEPLQLDDMRKLTELNRWKKVTRPELVAEGAKYYAFICPREQLITRPFPLHGSFAYIFHEPYESPDHRDCYFTPLLSL